MAGKFEVYRDKAGEYRFRLKARNGEVVLTSEGYSAKSGAMNGVQSVQKNASNEKRFESSETKAGNYRFNLKAGNHQVIGTSENYSSASSRDNGIGAVGRAAVGAKISDLTASD